MAQQSGNARTMLPLMATGMFSDSTSFANFMVANRFACMDARAMAACCP
jgi:hypothetical protein